ncbi:hypothetical protein DES40_1718 [Litorimonas taeanensis]|uniref:Uncharacterized protein n=1 Tax=Litorimonas taeanensis TaxID=568099 RepID=A0A420WDH4_9PROT|nr:hypothetical protein [Litorimonas taeanensis]RKQ68942.1 hypothetical protein DES40_1718 [Litorimonas taeanensis]
MVLMLSPDKQSRTLSLAGGDVTITVAYADIVTRTAARNKAASKMRTLADGGEVLSDFGYSPDHLDALTEPHVLMGFSELAYAVELGVLIIESWTGVETPSGENISVSRAAITEVMKQIGSDFIDQEARAADKVILEGNVFSPSRNGIGAAAENIANPAKTTMPPAPKAKKA